MKTRFRWKITLLVAFLLLLGQGFSVCVRGNCADSAEKDREIIAAIRAASTVCYGYTVREIHYGKATMREYIAPSGVVFGIDWKGMVQPDITHLLGSFADAYLEDLLQVPCQRRNLRIGIESENIVVRKWGPSGDVRGCAYVPGLVPPGEYRRHVARGHPA
jgi:hypothetical protein